MLRSVSMGWLLGFLGGLFLGIFGAVLAILRLTVPRLERLYVFRPSRDIIRVPSDLGLPYDQCFIDTSDGARLCAWHLCPPQPVGSVVYFHGSAGNLGIYNELFAMFYRHRLQVFAVDYRGYGWSTGIPSEEGLYEDAECAVRYFDANFRLPHLPVVYWGRSLGGCIAAYAAARFPPSGLILETAFPSKESLLEEYPQLRLVRYFSRYKLDTVGHLKHHHFPVLILHGDKDRTVPMRQAQILFNRLTGPKEFWRVPGAGHIDIHMVDSQAYMRKVLDFVGSVRQPVIH